MMIDYLVSLLFHNHGSLRKYERPSLFNTVSFFFIAVKIYSSAKSMSLTLLYNLKKLLEYYLRGVQACHEENLNW